MAPLVPHDSQTNLYRDNQESRTKSRSNEKPKEKEHTNVCSKSYIIKPSIKIIKSVQTTLSSIDLITVKRKRKETRKIKSHEDMSKRRRDSKDRNQEEILEWLRDVYHVKKVKRWSEKLQRVAEKLKKPGEEEKLRTKIERYLQTVPSQFSDYDKDGKEFREHLPEQIIKKFKVYLKKDKVIPMNIHSVGSKLISVIRRWVENVPLKKKDYLARPIKREDIVHSLAQRLEPFVLHRPNSDYDFKCMLKSYSMEIVNEIPININFNIKNYYVDKITDALVDDLINVKSKTQDCKNLERSNNTDSNQTRIIKNLESPSPEDSECFSEEVIHENFYDCNYDNAEHSALKAIKDFVTDEITHFLEDTESGISRKRMGYLEDELSDILMDAVRFVEHYPDETVKEDINLVLKNVGGLTENQVRYFANSLHKHFTQKFLKDFSVKPKQKPRTLGYLENYFVSHNPTLHNHSLYKTRNPSFFSDVGIEENINSYTNEIANQIDKWLMFLHIQTPFVHRPLFKEIAIGDLARDVVNRRKYLAQNPYNKGTNEEELDHLKYQIFKWIGQLVGDKNKEVIKFAPDLMRRIESVPVSALTNSEDIETVKSPKYDGVANSKELTPKTYYDQLKDEVFIWLQEMAPHLQYCDDVRTRYQFAENLVDRIELGVKVKGNIHTVVDTEVDFWIKKALKAKPCQGKITNLKDIIKSVLDNSELYRHDVRLQVEAATSDSENNVIGDIITSDAFEEEFELYTIHVAQIIDKWLTNLIPQVKYNSQKDIAVNGLATYIVDRYKHSILLNSTECRWIYVDLEDLKYQIYKWMKSLVRDDIVILIEHCSNFIERIQTIPRPSLTKDKETSNIEQISANTSTNNYVIDPSIHHKTTKPNVGSDNDDQIVSFGVKLQETQTGKSTTQMEKVNETGQSNVTTKSYKNNLNINTDNNGPIHNSYFENRKILSNYRQRDKSQVCIKNPSDDTGRTVPLNQVPIFGRIDVASKTNDNSCSDKFCSVSYTMNLLAPNETEVYNISPKVYSKDGSSKKDMDFSELEASHSFSVHEDTLNVPKGMTINETYQHFDKIFKEKIQELPIAAATGDEKTLAEVARNGIYNGIWKTYFKLKLDPNTENDYGLFECIFEDELDSLLDCLPQTPELKAIRHGWKLNVLQEVLDMLKYIHTITDAPSFRQHLTKKFNRKFLKNRLKEYSDQLQYAFVSGAADAFILYTRFKHDDPMKANIYRKRLIKRLHELAEYVKKRNDVEFRFVDQNQLCQEAFKILGSIQVPNDETLSSEADDILYGDEIEQWYAELPVKVNTSVFDDLMKNKLIDFLTKRLRDIEKHKNPDDPTVEREMKHEISQFLEKNADLQPDERLNINYMVDALTNRLRNRRLDALGYDTFEKETPFSSTFTDPKPVIFTPLVNQPIEPEIPNSSILKPQFEQPAFNSEVLGTSQAGPSTANYGQGTRPSPLKPQSDQRFTAKPIGTGILGTSQVAGPPASIGYGPQESRPGILGHTVNPAYSPVLLSSEVPEQRTNVTGLGSPNFPPRFVVDQSYVQGLGSIQNYSRTPVNRVPLDRIGSSLAQAPMASTANELISVDEEFENDDEIVRCRCMERIYRSRRLKRLFCLDEDLERYPCLYEMVHPYSYY